MASYPLAEVQPAFELFPGGLLEELRLPSGGTFDGTLLPVIELQTLAVLVVHFGHNPK